MPDPIPLPDSEPDAPPSRVLAVLQLVRFANVFTAVADIFLGFAMMHGSFEPTRTFVLLLLASVCHYWAGMIFNDVFDRDIDARDRPLRPIPSGRVSLRFAVTLGLGLNGAGLVLAGLVGMQSLCVALALTAAIYLYDKVLKKTPLGPVMMGSCRFFNVLLGASAASDFGLENIAPLHVAAGLGLFVCGLTWFAKQEAKMSNRRLLVGAALVINAGLAVLLAFLMHADTSGDRTMAMLVLAMITITILRRLVAAIFDPSPQHVQVAIKVMLLSLVMLDALLVVFTTGDNVLGFMTVALLAPTLVLARWIPMT